MKVLERGKTPDGTRLVRVDWSEDYPSVYAYCFNRKYLMDFINVCKAKTGEIIMREYDSILHRAESKRRSRRRVKC